MRIAAIGATLLLVLQACSTTGASSEAAYTPPNQLMSEEITRRIGQIPYQHRDELFQNLQWLAEAGEQTIPSVLQGLRHENPKVRSSCAWVLGRLRDRRTIPNLQAAMRDSEPTVRMEVARTLVLMGDLAWSPTLIEGLDHERKEVRFLCHEALKTATGHDFGYDHLNQDQAELRLATLRWRQWWGEYSGDTLFASSYERQHGLSPAAPAGETRPNGMPADGQPMPLPETPLPETPMPAPQPSPRSDPQPPAGETPAPGNGTPPPGGRR